MARHLRMTVYATDDNDVVHCFTPSDTVPDWVVDKIANDDAWADDEPADVAVNPGGNEAPPVVDPDALPPKSGAGSGNDVWIAWARAHGIDVADDAPRSDVIEAVEAWLDEQPKS